MTNHPKVELPTSINTPPAPRVTEVDTVVGGFRVHADCHGYRAVRADGAHTTAVMLRDQHTADPQTNAQRAVQQLVNQLLIPAPGDAP